MVFYVYMLRLQNASIYVGSTDNLFRRLQEHHSGNGGHATRKSKPFMLIHSESLSNRSLALKRERQLKRWSRAKKIALAESRFEVLKTLAKRRSGN